MANIERVLWDSATQDASTTVAFKAGSRALKAGTIKVFWPVSADGTTGNENPVVEYRVRFDNGHQVSVDKLENFSDSGVTIALGVFTERPARAERLLTITNTGTVGVLDISVILVARPDNSSKGISDRLSAVELEVASLGGTAVPPNAAIADITSTSIAAASKPTGSADVATLEGKLGPIIDALNVNRSVTMDMRTKFNLVLAALEDHGILNK